MNVTMNTNGRTRKTLASQLDRLDQILDCLSDGLNEAVALAVKEAVTVAVRETLQAVLTEILSNPQILEKLRGTTSTPTTAKVPEKVKMAVQVVQNHVGRLRKWVGAELRACGEVCKAGWTRVRACCKKAWQRLAVVRRFKYQLAVAVGIGVAVGGASYFAEPC
jgi:hypothetical protein